MKSDVVYLRHMLDAIAQIQEYVQAKSSAAFKHDRLLQDGVIRQLSILGEAARHVSSALQQSYPTVPWADVVGMRNILIHDYVEIDVAEVWKTVHDDLPLLREQLRQTLDSLTSES
jgi:uncharacterized protein with HEPN domain